MNEAVFTKIKVHTNHSSMVTVNHYDLGSSTISAGVEGWGGHRCGTGSAP